MKKVLTIAGSDCSGGAGIQADLKTITAYGMYGMSAITALTVQNTKGVFDICEPDTKYLSGQLEVIFTDIMPDAVKIGMLSSPEIVRTVTEALKRYQPAHVVVDPVMVSTSGYSLAKDSAAGEAAKELYSLATVLTPNLPETEALLAIAGLEVGAKNSVERGHGAGGKGVVPAFWNSGFSKGRPPFGWCGRLPWREGGGRLVFRRADRNGEYPWNRLYLILCHCLRFSGRLEASESGGVCQMVFKRGS